MTNKDHARFCLAPDGCTATQDVSALAPLEKTRESVYYIVAFLTLDEVSSWIKIRGLMKGGIAEFSERPISTIPFRPIDWTSARETAAHEKIVSLAQAALNNSDSDSVMQEIRQVFISELSLPT
jgi:adenine-specific DNA-methyltransferase